MGIATSSESPEHQKTPSRDQWVQLNRFVSTLAGAFRSFFLYRQDHKVLDEIMANVIKRLEPVAQFQNIIKLGVTNRSLTFEKTPLGFDEVTVYLASALRNLGIKEMLVRCPVQALHLFPIYNILSGKDSDESKFNKLLPYLGSDSEKPVCLIPITANLLILRMDDSQLKKRLEPLLKPKNEGGFGFVEDLARSGIANLPDLYTWICVQANRLPEDLRYFVRNLTDAAREGYFPCERFLTIFPMPEQLRARLISLAVDQPSPRSREKIRLGHQFHALPSPKASRKLSWTNWSTSFSAEEVKERQELLATKGQMNSLQELELTHALLKDKGPHFIMGLRILIRILANENTIATQEKALKLAISIWNQSQKMVDDVRLMGLLSALRQILSSPQNIALILFPLRSLSLESDLFLKIGSYLASLGESVLPSLIKALEAESERIQRRKLCLVLTTVAKEAGYDPLIEALPLASPYLLRNLIMILGDLKASKAVEAIHSHVHHSQKIVSTETIRSLMKIGDPASARYLVKSLNLQIDLETKKKVADFLGKNKDASLVDPLIQIAKDPSIPQELKKTIWIALGNIGGSSVKAYLESIRKGPSLMGRFSSEEKESQALINSLLSRIP